MRLGKTLRSLFGSRPRRRKNLSRERAALYKRSQVCAGCQYPFRERNLTVDHVKPFDLGGSDDLSNFQLLCGACNSLKGKRSQEWFAFELKRQGLMRKGARPTGRRGRGSARSLRPSRRTVMVSWFVAWMLLGVFYGEIAFIGVPVITIGVLGVWCWMRRKR